MPAESVTLPDGSHFDFWDDATDYGKIYHVARENPAACDANPGSAEEPFATISRAAEILQPGQKVVVHQGVYRERIGPARGGDAADMMIAYEAAPGERVVVKGSEIIEGPFTPTSGWRGIAPGAGRPTVWTVELQAEWFVGYNPFGVRNIFAHYLTFIKNWTERETNRLLLRRGMIFADGRRLTQVNRPTQLAETDGAFWVEESGLRIHLRLRADADPNEATIEATAREQIFAPAQQQLGHIRVSGFCFEHCANGLPVPQHGMVSTFRGHHWIIEDNAIRHASSLGMDIGKCDWGMTPHEAFGRHIIRRNVISDCGICGIAGAELVDGTLVEDNVFERIGFQNVERLWECAALKFHRAVDVLLRRNVFRHISHASGLWLDYLNRNCRITQNVFTDIQTILGACFVEVSHDEPNLVDGNLFWDIRLDCGELRTEPEKLVRGGVGCLVDCCENVTVAHNFFGKVTDHWAASLHLEQHSRIVGGRNGLCRRQSILNNVFFDCPQQIALGRAEENVSDGNCFDDAHNDACMRIDYPRPQSSQNFEGWREYFDMDAHSTRNAMQAEFDPETLTLTLRIDGPLPEVQPVPTLGGRSVFAGVGPLDERQWQDLQAGRSVSIRPFRIVAKYGPS